MASSASNFASSAAIAALESWSPSAAGETASRSFGMNLGIAFQLIDDVLDYGGKAAGKPIEVLSADHQNKTDVGVNIARRWYEAENVDALVRATDSFA